MGLDMYAYTTKAENLVDADKQIELEWKNQTKLNREFAYWRKFNALHAWMEDLYRAKGGKKTFNCVTLRLTMDDINSLAEAVKNRTLTPRSGFFFGPTDPLTDDDYEEVNQFVLAAREAILDDLVVIYDSWW